MIAKAGASSIGLNFYAPSKRYVAPSQARLIRDAVVHAMDITGVFVNSPVAEVCEITEEVGLDIVQFHGDETVEMIADFHSQCPDTLVIRAFRVDEEGLAPAIHSVQTLQSAGVPLIAVLLDAHVAGEYGGTGHQIAPAVIQDRPKTWPPLILAGGLTPETVAAASSAVDPWGIDTASGVESGPGKKCGDKVRKFISAADATEFVRCSPRFG